MFKNFGSLWAKKTKEGRSYLSGELEMPGYKIRINVFPNDKKEKPNQPDYRIVYSTDDDKQRTAKADGGGFPGLDDNSGGAAPVIQLDEDNTDGFPSL